MKSSLLLVLVANFFFLQSIFSQTTIFRETERLTSYWDHDVNNWQEQFIDQSTYNSSGQITQYLSKRYNTNPTDWENTTKDDYTYYPGARTYILYTWDVNTNEWSKASKDSQIYVTGGSPEYEYYSSWDNNTNTWRYSSLYTRKYVDGQVVDYLYQTYKNNTWINWTHTTSTWNGGNLMETLTKNWDESTGSWQDKYTSKVTYTYNGPGGSMDSKTGQIWDVNVKGFVNANRQNTTGNITIYQNWTNNAWTNTQRSTDTRNSRNQIANTVYEQWTNNVWSKAAKDIFQYDANGNITEIIQQNYSSGWDNSYRYTYKYASYLGISEIYPEAFNVNVFPNPASDAINFQFGAPATGMLLQISDLTGRCVYSSFLHENSKILQIPISFLENEIYTYRVISENKVTSGKVFIKH